MIHNLACYLYASFNVMISSCIVCCHNYHKTGMNNMSFYKIEMLNFENNAKKLFFETVSLSINWQPFMSWGLKL